MPHGTQRTPWRLNGADLGELLLADDTQRVFPLAPGSLRAGESMVEIDMPDAHRPNDSDGRSPGLAFKLVRLE
jgi:hypothetical protein